MTIWFQALLSSDSEHGGARILRCNMHEEQSFSLRERYESRKLLNSCISVCALSNHILSVCTGKSRKVNIGYELQLFFCNQSCPQRVSRTGQVLEDSRLQKLEGNGPIDLRRQGQWEIGMWCCMISINPTLRVYLTSYLKSATLITLVSMCILPPMASETMATS